MLQNIKIVLLKEGDTIQKLIIYSLIALLTIFMIIQLSRAVNANYKLHFTAGAGIYKGGLVFIVGELRQDRWEQEGQSRSRIKINADKVVNLTKRNKPADEPSEDSQGKEDIDEELDTPF